MNLLHLKYAVEVAKTASITRAAENLYMGQPNLSRAIRELEEEVGVRLFHRTPRGIAPTEQGEAFLTHARAVLKQMEEIESMCRAEKSGAQRFSVAVPRAEYVACAFAAFAGALPPQQRMALHYREAGTLETVRLAAEGEISLGIIRFQTDEEKYVRRLLESYELDSQRVFEFQRVALMDRRCPLAGFESVGHETLALLTEIVLDDPLAREAHKEKQGESARRIVVYERGAQLELLKRLPDAYMWTSPVPTHVLEAHGLVTKRCDGNRLPVRDLLIYKKEAQFSELDERFMEALEDCVREIGGKYGVFTRDI